MLHYTLFGESHGRCVGIVVEGFPAGLPVDEAAMRAELLRRQGGGPLTTARREADRPIILSGVYRGFTTGEPLCLMIENHNAHSEDYDGQLRVPRPGHADYTAWAKSGGYADPRGGGHHSGRLTAPLVAVLSVAKEALKRHGISVCAELQSVGGKRGADIATTVAEAKAALDSVGGVIFCRLSGVPVGLGSAENSVESVIARHVFGIPAVKAVGFGDGEALGTMRGSKANDAFCLRDGRVETVTNHCGGILGGISDGMEICFTATVKPTPSIAREQQSVDLAAMRETTISTQGRHDPCVALRAVSAVEAAAALAILELLQDTSVTEEINKEDIP